MDFDGLDLIFEDGVNLQVIDRLQAYAAAAGDEDAAALLDGLTVFVACSDDFED